jgi:hypothetical protein
MSPDAKSLAQEYCKNYSRRLAQNVVDPAVECRARGNYCSTTQKLQRLPRAGGRRIA